jgi:hypothetical protein
VDVKTVAANGASVDPKLDKLNAFTNYQQIFDIQAARINMALASSEH